jgi:Flp pilus assembly protein TadD
MKFIIFLQQYLILILLSLFILYWFWRGFQKSEYFLQLNVFLFPGNAEKHFGLGYYLCEKRKNLDRAEKEFRQAIALEPKECRYFLALALLLHDDREKSAEAIRYYQQTIELDVDRKYADIAYLHSGFLFHERLNRFEEAEKAYRRAIELSPANPECYFRLGWLLHDRLHRYSEAEDLYLKALELNPQDETTLYNLACIKSVNRDSDSAFTYLLKAIEKGLDPNCATDDKDLEWLRNDPRFNGIIGLRLNTK